MTAALPARLDGPELAGLWARCWRAMARAGPDGWEQTTIRLPLADDGRRRAIAGLLGRPVRPGTAAVSIRLGELDGLLRRAGDGFGLVAVVEAVRGPLPDRAGEAAEQQAAIVATCAEARAVADGAEWVEPWLAALERGMLARLHRRGELDLVVSAARVLATLPADGVPLPALASALTGDPKSLSGTTFEGLVLRGLALRHDEPRPRTAADRRGLWEAAGVVTDDLASQVLVLGLPVAADGGLGSWLADAASRGWPFRVTLHQLVRSPVTVARPAAVFVCENPAVLRAATERLGAATAPLVCTEGRPSVACLRLLALLRDGGCELRYHGDLDWPGVRIAAAVLAGTGASPWRLTAADYRAAVASLDGGRTPLGGARAETPWDPALAQAMAEVGTVVYEEDVLDLLLDDLDAAAPAR